MSSTNKSNEIISHASPHTVKKFELVEAYTKSWAQKLLQNKYCEGLVFIDCMCNSGLYRDYDDNLVYGTPIRVAKVLRDVAGQYPKKRVYVYLNDISSEKILHLRSELPNESQNFRYRITSEDANTMLKNIGPKLPQNKRLHYFLFYDPYDASIDWDALAPFFLSWGEVLINHMVIDPVRAVPQVRTQEAKQKYEQTYLADFETLLPCGADRMAYEARVSEIISLLSRGNPRKCYVATFPFFNSQNSLQYDLIHFTSNEAGFKLFKETAWKTFGGRSSTKHTHGAENQYMLGLEDTGEIRTQTDESCFSVLDIADYLQHLFRGRKNVLAAEVWAVLDRHPIFPSSGYRREIKNDLKHRYGATITTSTISFTDRG